VYRDIFKGSIFKVCLKMSKVKNPTKPNVGKAIKAEAFTNEDKVLIKLGNWDMKTMRNYSKYISLLNRVPYTKRVLNTMIDVGTMYQPIERNILRPDWLFGELKDWNEYRAARRAQLDLHKRDIIETKDKKGGKALVVTSRGHKLYYKKYPLAALRKEKWDGFWTIIMYDFPEVIKSAREIFRKRLISYGCGSPQLSILATPLSLEEPIRQLIVGEKLERYVWILRAEGVLGMKNRDVALKAWPISELNDLYRKLFDILPKVKKHKDRKILMRAWGRFFLAVNFSDPHLPFELLPDNWLGERCKKEFSKFTLVGLIKSVLS